MTQDKLIRLHLACGPNVVDGWDNLDILDHPGIIAQDLRKPLPYQDNTVDRIFHEHFIEHLTKIDAERFLAESLRVMKPGAAVRIGWPDLRKLLRAYALRQRSYMNHVLPHLDDHRFGRSWDEVVSDCLFSWEHRYAYTAKHLMQVLDTVGFQEVKVKKAGDSDYDIALDFRRDPATTYVEGVKR